VKTKSSLKPFGCLLKIAHKHYLFYQLVMLSSQKSLAFHWLGDKTPTATEDISHMKIYSLRVCLVQLKGKKGEILMDGKGEILHKCCVWFESYVYLEKWSILQIMKVKSPIRLPLEYWSLSFVWKLWRGNVNLLFFIIVIFKVTLNKKIFLNPKFNELVKVKTPHSLQKNEQNKSSLK